MDKIEKDKLYLIWLSCKDFKSLSLEENQRLFKYVWRSIRRQMEPYSKLCDPSIDLIIKTFKKIHITIDPRQPCGYAPDKDALLFNMWSLFFHQLRINFVFLHHPSRQLENLFMNLTITAISEIMTC